jgi:hypothetical protein
MALIPNPPYSPDLALCDLFLFPKIKLKLTEKDFQEAFQKMEKTGSVSTCERELLRG